MNLAIWRKMISESWTQLLVSSVLLVLFGWVFVWMASLFRVGAMNAFLSFLPKFVEPLLGIPINELATVAGRLSFLYVHVITLLVLIGWAVGRGSDMVAGEIGRGTMDLLLSLPIRRVSVPIASAVVTAVGSFVLSAAVWAGNWIGLMTVEFPEKVSPMRFLPGVINLGCMTFALAGLTAFFSSWDRNRWRTIWLAGGFFAIESIIKMVARLWEPGDWLKYLSFLTAFEPQKLILLPADESAALALQYNGTLVGIALAGYLAATLVLCFRDIPQAH